MALFGLFKKDVLYFPGCFSLAFLKNIIENYRRILKKIDLKFETITNKELICCGGILEQAGYEKQLRKIAKENAALFQQKEIKKIITNCPLCLETLKNYKEIMPNFDIETEFIISTVLNAVKEDEKLIRISKFEPIVYYDSCYLSRYSKYIEQPRELLRLLGYTVLEIPFYNREETLCCGNCGNLPIVDSELSEEIALQFIKKLTKMKVKKIVTADCHAYYHLYKIIDKFNLKIQIFEISELICESLGLEKSDEEIDKRKEIKEEQEVKAIVGE
jgi:Fe-S oxidoreductase